MSKEKHTMKLHDLRGMMDTDAMRRVEAQAETIRELIAENKTLQARLNHLQKRCFAITQGRECKGCPFKPSCIGIVMKGELTKEEKDVVAYLRKGIKAVTITSGDKK